MFIEVQTPSLDKVYFGVQNDWVITHHRLFNVSPDQAPTATVIGGDVSIWHLCFTEDLLQVVNKSKGILLDVGWYPDTDPNGRYKLVVIRIVSPNLNDRNSYDWNNPTQYLETRSLTELLDVINEILVR